MGKNEWRKVNISKQSLCWLLCFSAGLLLVLWKCPYGFGGSDEGFYLTVSHRLCLGDSLFADEWHLSQLTSFFLYPFVRLYRMIHGSNEGILLASRHLYVLMHTLVSLMIYLRLKHYGPMAGAASVLFLLFTPFNMMTCSYNTIALDLLALSGVMLGGGEAGDRISWFVGGAAYACAVVCCPYLALGYVLYIPAVLVFRTRRLKCFDGFGFFTGFALRWLTMGILLPFLLFVVFFLRHTELSRILQCLPGILADPEHPSYSLWFHAKHYVYCIVTAHRLILIPLGLYALSLLGFVLDRKRMRHRGLHLTAAGLCALLCFALFARDLTVNYYNAVSFPFVMPGFTAYLIIKKKPVKLFCGMFLPGLLYSVCVSSTSNMGFDVIAMAYAVVNVAGVVFVGMALREMREDTKYARAYTAAALLVLLVYAGMLVGAKAGHCFWDGKPSQLSSVISAGPARGIKSSPGMVNGYMQIYEDMQYYTERPRKELLVMSQIPWCYLIAEDYPYGSFSAWLSGLDESTVQRLQLYYSLNPDKLPRYIYIVKDSAFGPLYLQRENILSDAERYGYTVTENSVSYKLEKSFD